MTAGSGPICALSIVLPIMPCGYSLMRPNERLENEILQQLNI